MERRKFVIGMGSLAAGGAAATGTGAFTAATVSRDAEISVANDANGYLQLTAGGARGVGDKVADDGNGELRIDLGANASGSGINDQSKYQLGAMDDDVQGGAISFTSLYDQDTNPAAAGSGAPYVEPGDGGGGVDQSAFILHNASGQNLDIRIGLNDSTGPDPNATVYLQGAATDIAGNTSSPDPNAVDGAEVVNTAMLDLSDPAQGQTTAVQALSFNNDNGSPNEAIPSGASVYVSLQVDTTGGETSNGTVLSEDLVISANNAADPGVD
jgi:hypothetical protein